MNDSVSLQSLGKGRFTAQGQLSFGSASAAVELVRSQFESCNDMHVDLSGVTEADSAGLAVLIEWVAIARRRKGTLQLSHLPSELQALAAISEVNQLLPVAD